MTVPFNYLSGIFHISKGNLNEDENKRPISSDVYKTVASVLRPCMFIIQETNLYNTFIHIKTFSIKQLQGTIRKPLHLAVKP